MWGAAVVGSGGSGRDPKGILLWITTPGLATKMLSPVFCEAILFDFPEPGGVIPLPSGLVPGLLPRIAHMAVPGGPGLLDIPKGFQ